MKLRRYCKRLFKRYTNDDNGNLGLTFGMTFVVLIACVGSGYDMNQLVSAKSKASSIADTAVLTAAIYYSSHGEPPQSFDQGLVHGHEYDASELNYSFNSLSSKMAENVKIKVTYDTANKEATARVYGNTNVAFMQIFGHSKLGFKAESVAKFSEVQIKDPASIMFVLDNSGSMEFDDIPYKTGHTESPGKTPYPLNSRPAGAQKRLFALENSVKGLMSDLRGIMDAESGDANGRNQRIIRTAMIPYSSDVLTDVDVPGQWGLLSNTQIDDMYFRTGTNSAPPLDDALDVMDVYDSGDGSNEAKIHIDEHGEDPLRYVIFMTDGQNNGTFDVWDARSGTETWRRWREERTEPRKCSRFWYQEHEHYHYYYDDDGDYTCGSTTIPAGYEYEHNSPEQPEGNGWEEGIFDNQSNLDSRSTCADLHAAGVEIFTIAFGLQEGWFYTNNWGDGHDYDGYGAPDQYPITEEQTLRAKDLMKYCASSENNYTDAVDSAALDAAFQKIGNNIIKELIRLKS